MASANRNIADSQVAFMTTAHLKLSVVAIRHHYMHHTARVLLKGQRLKPEEILLLGDLNIDQTEAVSIRFKNVWVGRLANLALKLLPHVADLIRLLLNCHFLLQPELEALVVDETHGAIALARVEEGVDARLITAPADFALDFATVLLLDHTTINFDCLLRIELILAIVIAIAGTTSPISSLGRSYPISLFDR